MSSSASYRLVGQLVRLQSFAVMQVDINVSPQLHPGPLSPVFYSVINQSFSESCVPPTYKTYIIVPVQKKVIMSCLKDNGPRALTSVSTKRTERLLLSFTQTKCYAPPGPFTLLPTEPTNCLTVSQQNMFFLRLFQKMKNSPKVHTQFYRATIKSTIFSPHWNASYRQQGHSKARSELYLDVSGYKSHKYMLRSSVAHMSPSYSHRVAGKCVLYRQFQTFVPFVTTTTYRVPKAAGHLAIISSDSNGLLIT